MPPTPLLCMMQVMGGTVDVDTCTKSLIDFVKIFTEKLPELPPAESMNQGSTLAESGEKHYILKQIFSEDRGFSGISYVRNVVKKLDPTVTVMAADENMGFGYSRLGIILPLWKTTRNIAFFFFVLVTIVAAFMIMFKVKISPQAVITLQQAIPKILVALILVTFSYAIAGFVIDLVYVAMGIFSQFFTKIWAGPNADINADSIKATWDFLNGWGANGFLAILIYSFLYWVSSIIFTILILTTALLSPSSVIWSIFLIVFFVINIVILIIYIFITTFNLFKALANFYVAVILGPIKLALGALPMSHGAFGKWIKSLLQNALIFPVTGILWYFAFLFLFGALNSAITCNGGNLNDRADFTDQIARMYQRTGADPNLVSQFTVAGGLFSYSGRYACWGPPLLREPGTATAIAFLLISASCILLLAKVPKMLKSAFEGQPFDMESAISEPIKAGGGYFTHSMAEKGELPMPIQGVASRVLGGRMPDENTLKVIGKTLQGILKR